MSVEAILEAHSASREALATRILAVLEREWSGLGSWDTRDVGRFLARVLPVVTAGQQVTARMVDGYVAAMLTEMTGERVNIVGLQGSDLSRGVPYEEVYRRPFVETWLALKKGAEFAEAVEHGLNRTLEITDDDLNLSYRRASSTVMQAHPMVERYRRVIRPEASKGGTCDLCGKASQNTYKDSDLLPIHTRCRCAVMPIVGAEDPAARMNAEDFSGDVTDLPVIRNHGELGPLLQVKGHAFTSEPAQAA